jgi:hypothetical protein
VTARRDDFDIAGPRRFAAARGEANDAAASAGVLLASLADR